VTFNVARKAEWNNSNPSKEESNNRSNSNNSIPNETQPVPNNPSNPYIQPQGGGRQREGPVKKPKVQLGYKQKVNIYEQAEEIEGLTEPKV
jgi:hypothetical protein